MTLFVDTSAWVAIKDRREKHHTAATAYLGELAARKERLITTDFILDAKADPPPWRGCGQFRRGEWTVENIGRHERAVFREHVREVPPPAPTSLHDASIGLPL